MVTKDIQKIHGTDGCFKEHMRQVFQSDAPLGQVDRPKKSHEELHFGVILGLWDSV